MISKQNDIYQYDITYQTYLKAVHLLGKFKNEHATNIFRGILNDKETSGLWKPAIEYLQLLGTDEAVEALCDVYVNRRGMNDEYNPDGIYTNGTHDELSELATKAILSINTPSAFSIILTRLNTWFVENPEATDLMYSWIDDRAWWLLNVGSELRKINSHLTLNEFVTSWLDASISESLSKWIARQLPQTKLCLETINNVLSRDSLQFEIARSLQNDLTHKFSQDEKIITERGLPTLQECINNIDMQSTSKKSKRWWNS